LQPKESLNGAYFIETDQEQETLSSNNSLSDDDEETDPARPDWSCNFQADSEAMPSSTSVATRDLICWYFQIARGMDYLVSKKV